MDVETARAEAVRDLAGLSMNISFGEQSSDWLAL